MILSIPLPGSQQEVKEGLQSVLVSSLGGKMFSWVKTLKSEFLGPLSGLVERPRILQLVPSNPN
jgi:hypothetical protein